MSHRLETRPWEGRCSNSSPRPHRDSAPPEGDYRATARAHSRWVRTPPRPRGLPLRTATAHSPTRAFIKVSLMAPPFFQSAPPLPEGGSVSEGDRGPRFQFVCRTSKSVPRSVPLGSTPASPRVVQPPCNHHANVGSTPGLRQHDLNGNQSSQAWADCPCRCLSIPRWGFVRGRIRPPSRTRLARSGPARPRSIARGRGSARRRA